MQISEEKIYELLGIKRFKKFVLSLMGPLIINPKIRRENMYCLSGTSIDKIEQYKNNLFLFASLHGIQIPFNLYNLLNHSVHNFSSCITSLIVLIINSYGAMLQRYNFIRINRVVQKMKNKENECTKINHNDLDEYCLEAASTEIVAVKSNSQEQKSTMQNDADTKIYYTLPEFLIIKANIEYFRRILGFNSTQFIVENSAQKILNKKDDFGL